AGACRAAAAGGARGTPYSAVSSPPAPPTLAIELTEPLSLILGAPLAAAPPRGIRFAAVRALKLAVSYMAVPSRLSPEELGVLLAAIIRQSDPQFTPAGVPPPPLPPQPSP